MYQTSYYGDEEELIRNILSFETNDGWIFLKKERTLEKENITSWCTLRLVNKTWNSICWGFRTKLKGISTMIPRIIYRSSFEYFERFFSNTSILEEKGLSFSRLMIDRNKQSWFDALCKDNPPKTTPLLDAYEKVIRVEDVAQFLNTLNTLKIHFDVLMYILEALFLKFKREEEMLGSILYKEFFINKSISLFDPIMMYTL